MVAILKSLLKIVFVFSAEIAIPDSKICLNLSLKSRVFELKFWFLVHYIPTSNYVKKDWPRTPQQNVKGIGGVESRPPPHGTQGGKSPWLIGLKIRLLKQTIFFHI